jgi:hypothetical protein
MANETNIIYTRALTGTGTNPGLPDTLAQLVVGQAQNESANFTSNVYLNSNNAFGYGYSGSKYQVGSFEGFAKYASLDDSAAEIVDYIYRRVADGSFPSDLTTIVTGAQYAALLSASGYFQAAPGMTQTEAATNYGDNIETWVSENVLTPIEKNPITGLVIFGTLAVTAYFLFKH